MEILPMNFKTLSYCGLWSENVKFHFLKSVYKTLVVVLIFHFTIAEAIEFVKTCGSEEDSTQGLFLSFTFLALCFKILNFVLDRKEMLNLLAKFSSDICQPNSSEEWVIFKRCTQQIDRIFLTFMILSQTSGIAFLTLPFLETGLVNVTLPFRTYQPYDVSNNALYLATYTLQLLAAFYGVLLNVTFDTMVYGFILLICAQYEILCHRLLKIEYHCSNFSIKKCVHHHVIILDLISSTQSFFMKVVTPLFFFSLITLGASVFKIIQLNLLSIEFFTMALYLMCMMSEIFCYCSYGNELTLKSKNVIDAVYCSNWVKFDSIERKGLRFIMHMSVRGKVISHHGQCILNLNTFVWIIKTSYSALNVLQKGEKA
ncbi:odorant receptor 46a-like [Belonocnema kinseyi]|uniref:odorant receptor 46a-like n=1 Tax=Belonocnema kinseyi TaxID=2817044 RepID=UPI00143D5849|nr:odorant receptor 46a-like [Belonocnema kinseyi]